MVEIDSPKIENIETKASKSFNKQYIFFGVVVILILIITGLSFSKYTGNTIIINNQNNININNSNNQDSNTEKNNMANPKILIKTSEGDITLELYPDKAPITVANFLSYVNDKTYDGTVFHRVIPGFMIQGGGFTTTGIEKPTKDPIKLESSNGLKNEIGTVAMARTSVPDSATNQFFINAADNAFLNKGARDDGYAVFGKVISGMDVVKNIESKKTTIKNGMSDWPLQDITITSVTVIK